MRRVLQGVVVLFALVVLVALVALAQSRAPEPGEVSGPVEPAAVEAAAPEPRFLPSTKSGLSTRDLEALGGVEGGPIEAIELLPSTKADAGIGGLIQEELAEQLDDPDAELQQQAPVEP